MAIAALLCAISIVTYIDRVNISVTARQMMPALGLTDLQMGQIFSAFVFGYALCQIPGGWLGDRWGTKRVLTLAIIWWSVFTALTAVAAVLPVAVTIGALGSLILIRFLVGVGEAAALPNPNRTVANWLAPHERGLGIGIAIGGIGIGSAMTPPVTAWIMVNFGWQTAFYAAALLGLFVAMLWALYATDRPADHPHVNAAEVALIEDALTPRPLPAEQIPLEGDRHHAHGMVARDELQLPGLCRLDLHVLVLSLPRQRARIWCTSRSSFCVRPVLGHGSVLPSRRMGHRSAGDSVGRESRPRSRGRNRSWPWQPSLLSWARSSSRRMRPLCFSRWARGSTSRRRLLVFDSRYQSASCGVLSGLMNTGANLGGVLSPTLTPGWQNGSAGPRH